MNFKSFCLCVILGITVSGYAQNVSAPRHQYSYRMVRLDSTYDAKIDPRLASYVEKNRKKMDKQMKMVIAHTDAELLSYAPQSPLSNFLTDILLEESSKYIRDTAFANIDVSLLNFGGIRTSMPGGNVTVGDVYSISPFDNYLTFIELKGGELRKAFERFNDKFNAPYSGATIVYQNNKPVEILVQGKPIDDNRIYRMVTLNFLSDGGDHILEDIQYQRVEQISLTFREFLIAELKSMTMRGKTVVGNIDGRVVVK